MRPLVPKLPVASFAEMPWATCPPSRSCCRTHLLGTKWSNILEQDSRRTWSYGPVSWNLFRFAKIGQRLHYSVLKKYQILKILKNLSPGVPDCQTESDYSLLTLWHRGNRAAPIGWNWKLLLPTFPQILHLGEINSQAHHQQWCQEVD